MAQDDAPRARDLAAGRLLARLSCGELAMLSNLNEEAVFNLGRNYGSLPVRIAVARVLGDRGVEFGEPGFVRLAGRLAPTREAVGPLNGGRLRRARHALGYLPWEIAQRSGVSTRTLARLERQRRLSLTPSVYAVVGTLQELGYRFDWPRADKAVGKRRLRGRYAIDPLERPAPYHLQGRGSGCQIKVDPDWVPEPD